MINIFSNPETTIKKFSEYLEKTIKRSTQNKQNFYIALSGGNTPKLLFKELKKNYREKIEWSFVHIFWGDERCVTPQSPESNFGETQRLLLNHIEIPNENIHPIFGEHDPENESARYSEEIVELLPKRNNLPSFDLIILGIGSDGHTASIFPDQMFILKSENFCEVASHPATNQKRITLTGKILNNAKSIVFLVTGSEKSQVVSNIINKKNDYNCYPAAHIIPNFGNLHYFLDNESSEKL
jgi:6-phosphogluconolactonase